MTETPLDRAHRAMEADPGDERARLAFYDRLAGSELFLLLEAEAEGAEITPKVFDLPEHGCVLLFDREERLAEFTGEISAYAAMSGRAACRLLAPQGLGAGVNLEVAPSSILLPPDAVAWLAAMETAPEEVSAHVRAVHVPKGLPEALLTALDARLAAAGGLADCAYLVGVTYESGGTGHMLGIVDAVPAARNALARGVAEALAFSGLEAGTLDVGFFGAADPVAAKLAKCGLRFDLPQPQVTLRPTPGSDPSKPPILR